MSLVFEKAEEPVPLQIPAGTDSATAAAMVLSASATAPPHPSTLNLGCGPEPENIDEAAIQQAAGVLLSSPVGGHVSGVHLAQQTGAWFYWRYAVKKAEQELIAELGQDKAFDLVNGDDRIAWHVARANAFRWVMKERFGFEFPE